jgi:alkylhydroperoxidase family enzyme
MRRLSLSRNGPTPHERLIGHNAGILERWLALEEAFVKSATFEPELREQVRRALAFGNRCEYCMAKAGPPDPGQQSTRIALATAFAGVAGTDHRHITEEHINVLREEFSEREIAELLAFISFVTAAQMFGAMLGLDESDLPSAGASPHAAPC